MEENIINEAPKQEEISLDSRLEKLAQNAGQTVDELLNDLESKQAVNLENAAAQNKSTGSQSTNQSGFFDPAGTEFLKGIWGK